MYCVIEGCGEYAWARGWCMKHYTRWRRHGDPNIVLQKGGGKPRPNRDELLDAIESGEYSRSELADLFGYSPQAVSQMRRLYTSAEYFMPNRSLAQYDRMVAMLIEATYTMTEIAAATSYAPRYIRKLGQEMGVPCYTNRHPVDGSPYVERPPFFSDVPDPPLPAYVPPTAPTLPAWATAGPSALLPTTHPTTPPYARRDYLIADTQQTAA